MPKNTLTDQIYRDHQPPVLRKLLDLIDEEKIAYARELQAAGVPIDHEIMIKKTNALTAMQARETQGLAYVAPWAPPGASPDTYPAYGPVAPDFPGAIRVSTDADDYPPYEGPPESNLLVSDKPVPGFEHGIYYPGRTERVPVRLGTEKGDKVPAWSITYQDGRHWRKFPASTNTNPRDDRDRLPLVDYWMQIPA